MFEQGKWFKSKGEYGHCLLCVGKNKKTGNYIFRDFWNYPETFEVEPSLVEEIKSDGSFIKKAIGILKKLGGI